MVLTFAIFLVLFLVLLHWKRVFRRRTWVLFAAAVLAISFFLAYVSVLTVWDPHPLSDDVSRNQDARGEYGGPFPWSKLSYPLFLNVYHTPFSERKISGLSYHGEAHFSILLVNAKVMVVNSTFSYAAYFMGPMPLNYINDFLLQHSPEFFVFLIELFASLNVAGAVLGILLAKTLQKAIR